jgi:hypothetical protein
MSPQITMRGAERPAKVQWSRPFLAALTPLSTEAAWQMFIDIADDVHNTQQIEQLLQLTDNMPLAVDLMAHLVDDDSCAAVLARWETEKTALLSTGHDHRSNLDTSIRISLSSPRMLSSPGALELLSLLSILPDGLSDVELVQAKLPIKNILACKAVLLGTSLAFTDHKKRLKSLVPIREHMQYFQPVESSLLRTLQKHFHKLLDLYKRYRGSHQAGGEIDQIIANLGNLQQVLLHGLSTQNSDLVETIKCIISLNNFTRYTGRGSHGLMDHIPPVFPYPCDHRLETEYITEVLSSEVMVGGEVLIYEGISHFSHFNDQVLEGESSLTVSTLLLYSDNQQLSSIQEQPTTMSSVQAIHKKVLRWAIKP